jgi:hypothetical protein
MYYIWRKWVVGLLSGRFFTKSSSHPAYNEVKQVQRGREDGHQVAGRRQPLSQVGSSGGNFMNQLRP